MFELKQFSRPLTPEELFKSKDGFIEKIPSITLDKDYWTKEKMISLYNYLNVTGKQIFKDAYQRWYECDIEIDFEKATSVTKFVYCKKCGKMIAKVTESKGSEIEIQCKNKGDNGFCKHINKIKI